MQIKSPLFKTLRWISLPWIGVCVGISTGLVIWSVLDQIQTGQVDEIFGQEISIQLDLRARESLLRFEHTLADYKIIALLFANHYLLTEYLTQFKWSAQDNYTPIIYYNKRPAWLPILPELNILRPTDQVFLTDQWGKVREVFQANNQSLPRELTEQVPSTWLDTSHPRLIIKRLAGSFSVFISTKVENFLGQMVGYLIILTPLDDALLVTSQTGIDHKQAIAALISGTNQQIIASADPQTLIAGTSLRPVQTSIITTTSLQEYEVAPMNLLFVTCIPQISIAGMSQHVRTFERRQRWFASGVFIFMFTTIIYLVSWRLNKALTRMTKFSQRALGFPEPGFRRGGNQLLLLEEWIQHFTSLVLKAREEMNRRHQAEMRESEALKVAMMEASLDALVTLNREGKIIDFNPAAERLLGLFRQEAIGITFIERFLPELTHTAFKRLLDRSRHIYREPLGRGELLVWRADKVEIPVELSVAAIELEDEYFYTLYIHDISSRKRAEQEIKNLARFASESPNPILRVTADSVLVYANNASRPLLRAWQVELNQPLPGNGEWKNAVKLALASSQPLERELELTGQIYSLLLAPIRDLGYVNIYARDITAVRHAEQEARQHQAELVHVCRLSALGEVAAGMAHELNQPLSAIVNYANGCTRRLQSNSGQTEEIIAALGQITTQAQRAGAIIRRLRGLVGKQAPARIQADLNQLVREVCTFLAWETNRLNIIIEQVFTVPEILVQVDLVQVEQVLLNLLSNALDALEERSEGGRRVCVRTSIIADVAQVEVEDNGPGISPEQLATIFHPFVTTKTGGMGMGLPISQTIIENHEGRIWADSTPGRGTIFYVALPLFISNKNL